MKNKLIVLSVIAAAIAAVMTDYECIFRKYFNVICPGCGMTSAVKSLFHLDFKNAFLYHPMVYSIPLIILYIIKDGKLIGNKFINYSLLILIGLGFLINYIIKLFFLGGYLYVL